MAIASKFVATGDIKAYMQDVGQRARVAARAMARAETAAKDAALVAIATEIERGRDALVAANKRISTPARAPASTPRCSTVWN